MSIHLLVVCFGIFLTGCTTAGDWLSHPVAKGNSNTLYPMQLERVQIGVTTKDDVQHLLGAPTDIQLSSDHSQASEAWSYAQASPSINPLQYIPGFGILALSKQQHQASFSFSFTPDGVVDGIGLGEVQPYGEQRDLVPMAGKTATIQSYGGNNPLTHNPRQEAFVSSQFFPE